MILRRGDFAQLSRIDVGLRIDIICIVESVGLLKVVVHVVALIHKVVGIVGVQGLASVLSVGEKILLVIGIVIEVGVGGSRL